MAMERRNDAIVHLFVACLAWTLSVSIFSVSAFSQIDVCSVLGGSRSRTIKDNTNINANANNKNNDRERIVALASTPGAGDFGELTSALATLDQQWQIQQRSGPSPDKPKWSKLMLPKEEDDEEQDDNNNFNNFNNKQDDFVWMLEPPNNSIPSCVVVFTGGAGLGQFPQVAYNELLSQISIRLNALCLTAPYEVGLDHFRLAKATGEKLRKGLLLLEERNNDNNDNNNQALPTFSLGHSLGCKLQTIYLAATGLSDSFAGVGFLAYNNFSFSKTIGMARSFAEDLRGSGASGSPFGGGAANNNPELFDSIFDFAEMAVGAIGVEFSPTPQDTERLIQLRYNPDLQAKTRIFRFGSDKLDSSQEFNSACGAFGNDGNNGNGNGNSNTIGVSNLEGGHLTPVFFQWNADDLAKEAMGDFADAVSPENLNAAKEAMGGFQGASFGDLEAFEALVDEVCDWILGKPPKQQESSASSSSTSRPQISSSSSSSSNNNSNA